MKILILNWRDIKNPSSGGAEVLTQEIAKRLVKRGHEVILFTSMFKGARSEEFIDGVNIIRHGKFDARDHVYSVYFKAGIFYRKNLRGKIDLVIDEVHGVPFFTPLYVKEKKIALICEMTGDLWDFSVSFPFNILGKTLEKIYPNFYKDVPILTISDSSKNELEKYGFNPKKIKVIPMGSSVMVEKKPPLKEKDPTLIFLSRLAKSKGVEDALKVIKILSSDFPKLKLWVVGEGSDDYKNSLKKVARQLDVLGRVRFFGYVSESVKEDLLKKAHILIVPSMKEGWGLTIHEAGAKWTPAITYNVPGLRDVIKNKYNGIICDVNGPNNMALNVKKLLKDRDLYAKLQHGAVEERKKHSWDNTIDALLEIIK